VRDQREGAGLEILEVDVDAVVAVCRTGIGGGGFEYDVATIGRYGTR